MSGDLTNFQLADCASVVGRLRTLVGERTPASLIRLGDGEGAVLSRPNSAMPDLWAQIGKQLGPHVSPAQVSRLADALAASVAGSDIVGIRDDVANVRFDHAHLGLSEAEFMYHFRAAFPLRQAESEFLNYSGAQRLAHLHQQLLGLRFKPDTLYCSAWVHVELAASGALADLLMEQKRVGLISSKTKLPSRLAKSFDVDVDFYEVPELARLRTDSGPTHYPDIFERTMKCIEVHHPGQVFLVGAGICGKIYCDVIKQRGGIGLDIGSVCDFWLGIASRPLVLMQLNGVGNTHVPPQLLLDPESG